MNREGDGLQECLDEMEAKRLSVADFVRLHPEASEDLVSLLVTAERFRHAPSVGPSQQFRSAARSRMLNLISSASPPPRRRAAPEWLTPFWRPRHQTTAVLARVAAGLAVLLFVCGVTAVAASEALPTSPLYSTKLALEDLRLAVATSDAERVQLYLDMSEDRVAELSAVADSAPPADLTHVAGLYEKAVRGAVREVDASSEMATEVSRVESALTSEEERLKQTLARLTDAAPARQSAVQQALGFVEQERAKLRHRAGEDSLNSSGQSGQAGTAEQPRQQQETPPTRAPSLLVPITQEPLPVAPSDLTPGPAAGSPPAHGDQRGEQGSLLEATPEPAPSTPSPVVVPVEEAQPATVPMGSLTPDATSAQEQGRLGQPPTDTPGATPAGGQLAPSNSSGASGPVLQQNADATPGPSTSGGPIPLETSTAAPTATSSPKVGPGTQGPESVPALGTPTPAPSVSAIPRSDGANGPGSSQDGSRSGGGH